MLGGKIPVRVFLCMKNKVSILLFLFTGMAYLSSAQVSDSTKNTSHLSGAIGVTNNGISLIPSFSLEKPAAIFNMSLQKGRFSFDPEFTFSLEGKPWYQLYWFRYKLVSGPKFQMSAGTHLGLNFRSKVLPSTGDAIITERYLVGELSPTYSIAKNINVGIYYLHGRGFDIGTSKALHFIGLNANFTDISIVKNLLLGLTPQVYYLNSYGTEGYYFASTFNLKRANSPISLKSTINKVIQTRIPGSKDFLWNLVLTYSFQKSQHSFTQKK